MSNHWFHPALVLLLGGAVLPLVPARLKKAFLLAVPALAFGVVLSMFTMARGEFWHVHFLNGPSSSAASTR